jgi:hypothetical protein
MDSHGHCSPRGLEIHVIDVDTAFLNSDMPDDQVIYIKQLQGYKVKGKENLVGRLNKGLYRLKQAGWLWYHKLKSIMYKIGFCTSLFDLSIFIQKYPNSISIVTVLVDDLGIFSNPIKEVTTVKNKIKQFVAIKDGGKMSELLGMTIS